MSQTTRAIILAVSLAAVLALPMSASASTIRAAGSAYTGNVNIRLPSSTLKLNTDPGILVCAGASGTNPRLASFGEGNVLTSSISTASASKGTLSRISFGTPLLVNSVNVHDVNTTVFTTFATAENSTPKCYSTINAISDGCVAEGRPASPNNTIAAQDVTSPSSGVIIRLTTTVNLACADPMGNRVLCAYTTGPTPGTPGSIASDVIPYNMGGSTGASTATFTGQPVYRSSGSSLCPSIGQFSASYQLYTGQVYPGGNPVYVTVP